MTTAPPVAFEIEIKQSPVKVEPAVMIRLQQSAEAVSTPKLDDIIQKLQRAEDIKEQARIQKIGKTDEKVTQARWRKSTLEADQIKKYKQSLRKIEQAEELREKALESKVKAAKNFSHEYVIEKKNTELEKKKADIESKLKLAEQLRQEALENKVQVAQKNMSKLQKAACKKAEQAKEVEDKNQAILENNEVKFRKSQVMQAQIVQKAKDHVLKVEKVLTDKKEKEAKQLEAKKTETLEKLAKAETRRSSLLEQVKEKAVGSASKKK